MSKEKEFIPWNGGECPVPKGTRVDVKHLDGETYLFQEAGGLGQAARWWNDGVSSDIIGWRLSEDATEDQERDDGGPAFPCGYETADPDLDKGGMSYRHYLIAHLQPPEEISRTWGEVLVGPYPKDDQGQDVGFGIEAIKWWAKVNAAWRAIEADAILAVMDKEGK